MSTAEPHTGGDTMALLDNARAVLMSLEANTEQQAEKNAFTPQRDSTERDADAGSDDVDACRSVFESSPTDVAAGAFLFAKGGAESRSQLDTPAPFRQIERMYERPHGFFQKVSRSMQYGPWLLQALMGLNKNAKSVFEMKLYCEAMTLINNPSSPFSNTSPATRMASLFERLDKDLKTHVVRQLDQHSASMYQQCNRMCLKQVTTVANRRSTPEMTSASSAPFAKSFTYEYDVAMKTWTLRLRLKALTQDDDKRRFRLVVQNTDFFSQPWCRIEEDEKCCTLDVYLPQDMIVHIAADTPSSKNPKTFFDVRLENTHVESQILCTQCNIHERVTFKEGVSIASESWFLWTADVDSAAAAVQSALDCEPQLKDFRFLAELRDSPLDNVPKIVNSTLLRSLDPKIQAARTPPVSPQMTSMLSTPSSPQILSLLSSMDIPEI